MATRVLIVDDEQKNLYLLQVLLTANGYTVSTAQNGSEALDSIYRDLPDVIVSDILMPVMDGFTFCRTCKADPHLSLVPFIFYTATYTDPKDEDLALSLGAERFIIKPTEPAEFLKILRETIEQNAASKAAARHNTIDGSKYFEEYSSVLIRKLEDKVAELEEKNRIIESDKSVILESEERLRESEERFRSAFDYAPIGKAIISLDGCLIKVNRALMNLLGYSEAELLAMKLSQFAHPDDVKAQNTLIERLLSGEAGIVQAEVRWIHQNSNVLYIQLHMSLVRDQAGKPDYLITQCQDISETRQAEEEIRLQIARAEALVRTSSSINSDLDLKTVLSLICKETARALAVPAVAIFMYNEDEKSFSVITENGLPDQFRENSIREIRSDYPPEYSIYLKSPLIIPDIHIVRNIPRFDYLKSLGIRSLAVSRLENKGMLIGELACYTFETIREFSQQEVELIEGLCNQAAQAITNARLYEKTKWQLRNIESLHMIDNAIANSMDIELMLMVVAEKTRSQLSVDATNLLLFNDARNRLESIVSLGFTSDRIRETTVGIGEGLAGQIAVNWKPIFLPDINRYEGHVTRADIFREEQFVTYCGIPLMAKGQLLGVMEVFHRTQLNPNRDWFDFIETLAGQAALAVDSIKSYENLEISNKHLVMAYDATIEGWSRAMDLRDKETEGHTQRVTQITIQLAKLLGIDDERITHIRRGALLHDMGKLGIPDQVLLKPGALTEEEWTIMRKHPQLAYDMLHQISYLYPSIEIPYCHHEKWDGSGYPRGLKGEEIPISARIFAVIDVWDALTNDRPYRKAWTREKAVEYIREQSGKHFDPRVASVFLENLDLFFPT
jgi:PAS domain S-box-containing protein